MADVAVVVPGGLGALYADLLGGATILRDAPRKIVAPPRRSA